MSDELFNDGENPEAATLRPITFDDYETARRNKTMLEIQLPSLTLIVNPEYSMVDIYRNLQSIFCELLCHDSKYFLEN